MDGFRRIILPSKRHFLVYSPKLPHPEKMTLLIFYHGKLGTAEKYINKSKWSERAEREKFIVCFAQAQGKPYEEEVKGLCYGEPGHEYCILYGNYWWTVNFPEEDLRYTEDIIAEISDMFSIDTKRIHALGFSQGGVFITTLAIKLPHIFASLCSYMGGLQILNSEGCSYPSLSNKRKAPLYIISGTHDNMLECCNMANQKFLECGYEVEYEILEDQDHHYEIRMEDSIWDFFSQHPFK